MLEARADPGACRSAAKGFGRTVAEDAPQGWWRTSSWGACQVALMTITQAGLAVHPYLPRWCTISPPHTVRVVSAERLDTQCQLGTGLGTGVP